MTDWIERLLLAEGMRLRAAADPRMVAALRAKLMSAFKESYPMIRRFFYDCEFLEDGRTIELISVGVVAEDGRELYLVNRDAPWDRIRQHGWLMNNVVPQLLPTGDDWRREVPQSWLINLRDPAVRDRRTIAGLLRDFLLAPDADGRYLGEKDRIELWASYAAYDHVCLMQLWGSMVDLPQGIPMRTSDIEQEADRLGRPKRPPQAVGIHHALEDARHVKRTYDWLKEYEAARHGPELLV